MALVSIAVALFVFDPLQSDIVLRRRDVAVISQDAFTLCGRRNSGNCVVDGDTIHYRGTKIRLAGIDAPEVRDYKCSSELALGQRATHRLLELMNAGPFVIVYRGGPDEDRYGRKLRTIERDGRSLGDVLVAEGLACRWAGSRRSWCG